VEEKADLPKEPAKRTKTRVRKTVHEKL